jgi:hypothetical protein
MARPVHHFSSFRKILTGVILLVSSGHALTPALAQHPGGHVVRGGHPGASPRISSPHVIAPPRTYGTGVRLRVWSGPLPAGVGWRGSYVRGRPLRPVPPALPFFPVPVFWGSPFFRFWPGFGFSSFWWPCTPYWGWGFGCSNLPYYGYGYGSFAAPFYVPAPYVLSEEARTLPRLYLKDGTVLEVTDYWLVDNELHFALEGETGAESAEHVIDFNELDLQKTIDVNTRLGFRFVLRNEPVEQYLRDHPDEEPPLARPPGTSPKPD